MLGKTVMTLAACATLVCAQEPKSRIIVFGAHPDDCDGRAGGTAALFAKMGHAVKFVSVTNGDAGHQSQGGGALAKRRLAEAREAGRRLGVEYDVLDNHDGELLPTLEVRHQIIRKIREWNADVVISPRPNDYHPDHRYTGILIQDAAYMVVVPNVCPDTPPLKRNPVFLYQQDGFQKPQPFTPDIAVDITSTIEQKIDAFDAHVSQVYEWLPWVDGRFDQVPKDPADRRKWLAQQRGRGPNAAVRKSLEKWYGAAHAAQVKFAEAFEICEYGKRPNDAEIRKLFPMLKQ
jgi:LmbE family N-acetylglucosaminyl deacetylase